MSTVGINAASEFVEDLAYELWAQRGHPRGSPNVDWFAAEQALREIIPKPLRMDVSVRPGDRPEYCV